MKIKINKDIASLKLQVVDPNLPSQGTIFGLNYQKKLKQDFENIIPE